MIGYGELRVMWGEGPNELPASRGWPFLLENKLFSKPIGAH